MDLIDHRLFARVRRFSTDLTHQFPIVAPTLFHHVVESQNRQKLSMHRQHICHRRINEKTARLASHPRSPFHPHYCKYNPDDEYVRLMIRMRVIHLRAVPSTVMINTNLIIPSRKTSPRKTKALTFIYDRRRYLPDKNEPFSSSSMFPCSSIMISREEISSTSRTTRSLLLFSLFTALLQLLFLLLPVVVSLVYLVFFSSQCAFVCHLHIKFSFSLLLFLV